MEKWTLKIYKKVRHIEKIAKDWIENMIFLSTINRKFHIVTISVNIFSTVSFKVYIRIPEYGLI